MTAKVSHHADDFLGGDHDFRFGVQYNDAGVTGIYGYNDLVFTYTYGGVSTATGTSASPSPTREPPATSGPSSTTASG